MSVALKHVYYSSALEKERMAHQLETSGPLSTRWPRSESSACWPLLWGRLEILRFTQ